MTEDAPDPNPNSASSSLPRFVMDDSPSYKIKKTYTVSKGA